MNYKRIACLLFEGHMSKEKSGIKVFVFKSSPDEDSGLENVDGLSICMGGIGKGLNVETGKMGNPSCLPSFLF